MQQKLCLWLAVAVLFGALAAGNPFLVERAQQRVHPAQSATDQPSTGKPAAGQPAAGQPATGQPATDLRPAGSVRFEATPALAVALNAPAPADASAALCPDLELRPLVVAVERNAQGELVWVLRDGTRWMRNKKRSADVLVEVDAAGATK